MEPPSLLSALFSQSRCRRTYVQRPERGFLQSQDRTPKPLPDDVNETFFLNLLQRGSSVARERFRPQIEFQLTRIAPKRCDTVRRTDEDLDIGTQPPGLGGQSLDLLARAGGRREQHNTLADDRKVPTHSGVPVITEERDAWPAHNTLT